MTRHALHVFVRFRLAFVLATNIILTCAGYLIALNLRFEFVPQSFVTPYRLWIPLSLLLFFRIWAYSYWNLNQGYWRYASTHELQNIIKAHAFSSLYFMVTILLLRLPSFPRSVFFIEFIVSVFLCGGVRLLVRMFCESRLPKLFGEERHQIRPAIILGAGASGHLLVHNLLCHPLLRYQPLLVLDDNENLHGGAVHGVRIAGPLSSLAEKLETYKAVAAVFSAIPSLSRQRVEEIEGLCRRIGIAFKRLQSFEEIALADGLKPVEKIRVESLLEKEINVQHEEEIRQAVLGKHILVTGAGGSIGSELVRQVLAFSPAAITLFDSSEYNLFQIERELVPLHPAVRKNFSIGSIANLERIRQVVREARPEIVFHAAAYKHVPLMESNCYEAFVNNVLGTRNTLASCEECGVRRFVLISTDKAVCPVSVMGCSKRLTELFVAERLQDTNGAQGIRCSIVRFGNVINSAGSVIPLFKAQIESGGPVTVTHPDMERYFMSIREAVRLVLTAGVLSEGSGAYVLDMGEPIKIVEVAKKMLALYGRRDVSIVFTGLRPGERLTESLTYAFERTVPSRFAKVQQIVSLVPSQTVRVSEWVSNLEQRLGEFTDKEIGALMTGFVAEVERSFAEKSLNGHELEAS